MFDFKDYKTLVDIKTGMETLLEKISPEFRRFLENSFGKYEPCNGGLQPWWILWDMSIAKESKIYETHKINSRVGIGWV